MGEDPQYSRGEDQPLVDGGLRNPGDLKNLDLDELIAEDTEDHQVE